MINIKLTGTLLKVSKVEELPNSKRKFQKLTLQVNPVADSLGRITGAINFYDIFIFGEAEILEVWSMYNDKLPDPVVTVLASLSGKMKVDKKGVEYNNITIRANKIIFNYDNH